MQKSNSGNFPYQIDWGDGTPADNGLATIDVPGGGGGLTQGSFDGSHTYADDGAFTVFATVTDPFGASATESFQVTVANVAPSVDAGPDVEMGVGATVVQTGSFTDPGDDTWTAAVDYGDGAGFLPLAPTSDKQFTLNLHYMTLGTRTVRVTVTDDDGGSDTESFQVTVSDPPQVTVVGDQTISEGSLLSIDDIGSFTDDDTGAFSFQRVQSRW